MDAPASPRALVAQAAPAPAGADQGVRLASRPCAYVPFRERAIPRFRMTAASLGLATSAVAGGLLWALSLSPEAREAQSDSILGTVSTCEVVAALLPFAGAAVVDWRRRRAEVEAGAAHAAPGAQLARIVQLARQAAPLTQPGMAACVRKIMQVMTHNPGLAVSAVVQALVSLVDLIPTRQPLCLPRMATDPEGQLGPIAEAFLSLRIHRRIEQHALENYLVEIANHLGVRPGLTQAQADKFRAVLTNARDASEHHTMEAAFRRHRARFVRRVNQEPGFDGQGVAPDRRPPEALEFLNPAYRG